MEADEIQKLWWLHDALWYQGVAKRFGYEAANAINQEAIRMVAKRAMRRVLAESGRDQGSAPEDFGPEEIPAYFRKATDLMWPPLMTEWEAQIRGGAIEVTVTRCYAPRGI